MNELNQKLDQLISDVATLKQLFDSLSSSSSIPRDIETALRERLGLATAISSLGTTVSASTQSVSVPSTPTSITVPAQPSGAVAVTIGSTTYNLLYK
jgi:L-cystine uptake protein TcyP (sodium:dicarboxylate symporter family)